MLHFKHHEEKEENADKKDKRRLQDHNAMVIKYGKEGCLSGSTGPALQQRNQHFFLQNLIKVRQRQPNKIGQMSRFLDFLIETCH